MISVIELKSCNLFLRHDCIIIIHVPVIKFVLVLYLSIGCLVALLNLK